MKRKVQATPKLTTPTNCFLRSAAVASEETLPRTGKLKVRRSAEAVAKESSIWVSASAKATPAPMPAASTIEKNSVRLGPTGMVGVRGGSTMRNWKESALSSTACDRRADSRRASSSSYCFLMTL